MNPRALPKVYLGAHNQGVKTGCGLKTKQEKKFFEERIICSVTLWCPLSWIFYLTHNQYSHICVQLNTAVEEPQLNLEVYFKVMDLDPDTNCVTQTSWETVKAQLSWFGIRILWQKYFLHDLMDCCNKGKGRCHDNCPISKKSVSD